LQAGRPVGGRFAADDDLVRLHPDVDRTRNLLVQDFMYSGGLEALAFASGAGKVSQVEPLPTDGGSGCFTDGMRAVLFLGTRPLAFSVVEILDWKPLPRAEATGAVTSGVK
jgi:hypothetical protein